MTYGQLDCEKLWVDIEFELLSRIYECIFITFHLKILYDKHWFNELL